MNRKEKRNQFRMTRRVMYIALTFVIVSIATMTLAYAVLSTTLNITGTATFNEASWDLKLEELPLKENIWPSSWGGTITDNVVTIGDAQLITKPTISGTSINNYKVSLTKPDDEIGQFYKLTNNGNIPAVITDAIFSDLTFSSSTNNNDDIALIEECIELGHDLYYLDEENEQMAVGESFNSGILCPGATLMIYIHTGYDSDATEVPSSKVTVSNISSQLVFTAGEKSLCNGSTPVEDNNSGGPV